MRYERPQSIEDATSLLANAGGDAKVLAGGTDLLVRMRSDEFETGLVVDIKSIPGMGDVVETDGSFEIGAAVPCISLGEHEGLKQHWPGVVEAANLIGSTQIQGRCTMSGNLCNASPAADSVPALVAAGARARIAGPDGLREVDVADIPVAPGKTSLLPGEVLVSLVLEKRSERTGDAYLRFIPRTEMDIAVVGVGVNVTLDESGVVTAARVALGAVAPTVVLSQEAAKTIIGTSLDDAALDALATACSAACNPIDDKRGTVEFRKQVSGVLAGRAARIARERAGGK